VAGRGPRSTVDLDALMKEQNTDAVAVHGDGLVFLCTLSSELCAIIRIDVLSRLLLSDAIPLEFVAAVLKQTLQRNRSLLYLTSYGASIRPQRQQTAKNLANTWAVIEAIGCKGGGRFTFPASSVVASVIPPVREVYKTVQPAG
jgi:hypothetical protein